MARSVCSCLLPPRGMFPGEHGIAGVSNHTIKSGGMSERRRISGKSQPGRFGVKAVAPAGVPSRPTFSLIT